VDNHYFINFLFLFFFLLINIYILKNLSLFAQKLSLIDYQKNKAHNFDTPMFGFFFFLNLNIFLFLLILYEKLNTNALAYNLLISSFIIIGYLDDRFNLNVLIRFFFSLLVMSIFYFYNPMNIYVSFNFNYLLNYILLIFLSLGFIHLVNITDGINGLVCSLFIYSCVYYFFKGFIYLELFFQSLLIFSLIGIIVFIISNFFGKCFLGNTGSYLIAIIISIIYTQLYTQQLVEYSDILLIFLIPLLDGLRVTIKRILNKKNPFKGDLLHFHHMIRNNKIKILAYYLIIFMPSLCNFFYKDFTILISMFAIIIFFLFFAFHNKIRKY